LGVRKLVIWPSAHGSDVIVIGLKVSTFFCTIP
jgi:hypothetical protein